MVEKEEIEMRKGYHRNRRHYTLQRQGQGTHWFWLVCEELRREPLGYGGLHRCNDDHPSVILRNAPLPQRSIRINELIVLL